MNNKIDYFCFSGMSGNASAARYYIDAIKNDFDLNVVSLDIARSKIKSREDSIDVYHCIPPFYNTFKRRKPSIGFATFENTKLPENWIKLLNQNNAVIVPSQSNYCSFRHVLCSPVFYIPHCLDMSIWNDKIEPVSIPDKFIFLFLGTWKKRKNCDLIIKAFLQEFKESEPVQLLLHTKVKPYKQMPKQVILSDKKIPERDLPRFFKSVNCLVNASLGEGFCLPGLQAMAVGTPVICPDTLDYANDQTSWLLSPVEYQRIPRLDGLSQFQDLIWPVFSADDLSLLMRKVFENKKIREEKAKKALQNVHQKFSSQVICKLWKEMISSVL